MLPETSSSSTSRIGCGVLSNSVIGCGAPFVADLELVLREVRDQPAVLVQHGDEHADEVRGAPEHRLLHRGRADQSHGQHAHRHDRGEPLHSTLAVRH